MLGGHLSDACLLVHIRLILIAAIEISNGKKLLERDCDGDTQVDTIGSYPKSLLA